MLLGRRRQVSLEDDALAGALDHGVGHGDGRQQRLRVRVTRMGEHVLGLAELDHLAEVHDGHAVGDVADDRQIVRNEQV